MQEIQIRSLGWEDLLEEEKTTHSNILAWEIPWTEEPGRLQSMGLQRVGSDLATKQQQQYIYILGIYMYIYIVYICVYIYNVYIYVCVIYVYIYRNHCAINLKLTHCKSTIFQLKKLICSLKNNSKIPSNIFGSKNIVFNIGYWQILTCLTLYVSGLTKRNKGSDLTHEDQTSHFDFSESLEFIPSLPFLLPWLGPT